MWWPLIEFCANAFQSFMIIFFLHRRLTIVRGGKMGAVLAWGILCTLFELYILLDWRFPDTLLFIAPFVYVSWAADEKWYVKLFWCGVLIAVSICVIELNSAVISSIMHSSQAEMMESGKTRLVAILTTNFDFMIALLVVSKYPRIPFLLNKRSCIVFLALLGLIVTNVEAAYSLRSQMPSANSQFIITGSTMGAAVIMILVLFDILVSSAEKQQRTEAALQAAVLTQNHVEDLKNMYSVFLAQQHDLQKQYKIVSDMMGTSGTAAGEQYFSALKDTVHAPEFMTGSLAMDALLTAKKAVMTQNHILFNFNHYPLNDLPLPESELCIIVANLLDNAIEAEQRISNAPADCTGVRLAFARSRNMMFITCVNDLEPSSIIKTNAGYVSSKQNKCQHGYGLSNIQHIVERYHGQCIFRDTETCFQADIIVPYEN